MLLYSSRCFGCCCRFVGGIQTSRIFLIRNGSNSYRDAVFCVGGGLSVMTAE